MDRIKKGIAIPSAAFTLTQRLIKFYKPVEKAPQEGDVVYGTVSRIGQHSSLENKSGRIYMIHNGSLGVFVFGNRYAPDYYEGIVPEKFKSDVDLLARSGIIGEVRTKNCLIKDPTKIKILGYICNENGRVVNTKDFPLFEPKQVVKKSPRSKLVLVCGTSMNSGKSMAATACCWALTTLGRTVRASKITGTASLKDILTMSDAGAQHYTDFTYLGYPSTYKLSLEKLLDIFNAMDLKYANNPKNFWVVEFADGIVQRETAMLLASPQVQSRIHRLIFCASDGFGAVGGLEILRERFGLKPHAISGVCSSSPLHVQELAGFTDIPVFNSVAADLKQMERILLSAPHEG